MSPCDSYPWLVVAPVAGLAGDVLIHLLANRIARGGRTLACFVAGFVFGLMLMVTLSAQVLQDFAIVDWWSLLAGNGAAYAALAFGYFIFVNLNISSVRIRILEELHAVPDGLTAAQILAQYNANDLIEKRLIRLTWGKQLDLRDGRLYSRRSLFFWIDRVIRLMKWAIIGPAALQNQTGICESASEKS